MWGVGNEYEKVYTNETRETHRWANSVWFVLEHDSTSKFNKFVSSFRFDIAMTEVRLPSLNSRLVQHTEQHVWKSMRFLDFYLLFFNATVSCPFINGASLWK